MKNKNLVLRILSAIVYLVILIIAFLNKYTFALVFIFFMLVCLKEFYKLTEITGHRPKKWFSYIFSVIIFLFFFFYQFTDINSLYIYLIVFISFLSLVFELLRDGNAIKNLSTEFFGILYITIPFSITNYVVFYFDRFDWKVLFGIFVIIWFYDIFAYFIGSYFGKKKIFPTISPKKTLEGTLGGIFFSILGGLAVFYVFRIFTITDWIILSVLVSTGALVGDLIESKLKRSAGVKESGSIMPGHGGLLDRFDSFLFAIVAASFYLLLIKQLL